MAKSSAMHKSWRKTFWDFFVFLSAILITALITGFIYFAIYVSQLTPPQKINKADGIVVWTGKGGNRVETGAKLLEAGIGERLLISGTNSELTREIILNTLNIDDQLKNCCVDLDHAENTIDNAYETANWATALGYNHLILVTSAYHMPRAEIEITNVIGRVTITPYPVRDDGAPPWWSDQKQFKRLVQEYAKMILSAVRNQNKRGILPTPQAPLPDISKGE